MKLSSKTRDKMPKSEFGEPGKRAYPMLDKKSRPGAKSYASKEANAGKRFRSAEAKIDV